MHNNNMTVQKQSKIANVSARSWFVSLSGDSDPDPRHRGDPGLVPTNPREAAGPEHHGSGLQQHRSHAGWVVPCLQDRVLSFTSLAVLPTPLPHPPPPSLSSVHSEDSARANSTLCFFKVSRSLMVPVSNTFAAALDTLDSVSWNQSQTSGFMLSVTVGLSRQ